MNKIAICISGQSRTYEKCYNSFVTYILEPLKCIYIVDIYLFIWKDDINKDKLIELYEPKKYIICEDFKYEIPSFCDGLVFFPPLGNNRIQNSFEKGIKQHYGVFKVFSIINENEYDFALRTRYDIFFDSPVNLNEIKQEKFFVGYNHTFMKGNKPTNLNDAFAFGKIKDMLIYSKFFENVDDILFAIKK